MLSWAWWRFISAQNNLQGLWGEISLAVQLTFQENKMTLKHHKKSLVDSCLQLLINEKGRGVSQGLKPIKKQTPDHLQLSCCQYLKLLQQIQQSQDNKCHPSFLSSHTDAPTAEWKHKWSLLENFKSLKIRFLQKHSDEMCIWVLFAWIREQPGLRRVTHWSWRRAVETWTPRVDHLLQCLWPGQLRDNNAGCRPL